MWKQYFKDYYSKDKTRINKLLELDGNYTYDSFYKLIEKNIDLDVSKYDNVLLEKSSIILLNIIDKDCNIIVCTMDNYGLNEYIIEIYNSYLKDNNIIKEKNVSIQKHFKIEDMNIISIGSNAFNREMNFCFNDIKGIDIEI